MRIDEKTYIRIFKAAQGLEDIGTSIIIFVGKTSQNLGEYNYDVFNNFANSQRDVIIDAFLSLKKEAFSAGGILEEIRNIPAMMKSSDNKIQLCINDFSRVLDGLITRAKNIPIVNTNTSNPIIPDEREAIYEDLRLDFKSRDFYDFNYNVYMLQKYYEEGDYVGDLVTSFQHIIVSALVAIVSKMKKEFEALHEKIGVVQEKLKFNIYTKDTSTTAPNKEPSFATGVAVGTVAAAATLGIKKKPKLKLNINPATDVQACQTSQKTSDIGITSSVNDYSSLKNGAQETHLFSPDEKIDWILSAVPNLTRDDAKRIDESFQTYYGNGFASIHKDSEAKSPRTQDILKVFDGGVVQPYKGTIYRGLSFSSREEIEELLNLGEWNEPGITSFTSSKEVAEKEFTNHGEWGLVLSCNNNKTAIPFRHISIIPFEEEVLSPGSHRNDGWIIDKKSITVDKKKHMIYADIIEK